MIFIVYSKENCSHCTRAILKLTQLNLPFTQLKLNEDFTRDELLEKFPQARTFPQIELDFGVGPLYIGGADDLEKFLDQPLKDYCVTS